MKVIGSVLTLIVIASARPDVSHLSGYNYNPPAASYGVPLHSVLETNSQEAHHYHSQPSQNYLPPSQEHTNVLSGHVGLHNANSQLVRDEKRVYYFSAPDVKAKSRLRINVIPQHQKNTNVIFVKAPNYEAPVPEVVIPPTHIEDKTKVVVLVKKPKHQEEVVVAAPPAIKADKPEVFVVNYKNKQEAEHTLSETPIRTSVGTGVHVVNDEHNLVNNLHSGNLNSYGVRYASGNLNTGSQGITIQSTGVRSGEGHSNVFETGHGAISSSLGLNGGSNAGISHSILGVSDAGHAGAQGLIKTSKIQETVEIQRGSGGLIGTGVEDTGSILKSLGVSGGEQTLIGGNSHSDGLSGVAGFGHVGSTKTIISGSSHSDGLSEVSGLGSIGSTKALIGGTSHIGGISEISGHSSLDSTKTLVGTLDY